MLYIFFGRLFFFGRLICYLEMRGRSQMELETWWRWLKTLSFSLGVGGWHGGRSKFACFTSGVANPEYASADLCSVLFVISVFVFCLPCCLVWSFGLFVCFCFPVFWIFLVVFSGTSCTWFLINFLPYSKKKNVT
jgi:hypothetical protein